MYSGALNCHTNDDRRAWFAVDLGVWLIPSAYTLRHARGYGRSALRSWQLQGSKDGLTWVLLSGKWRISNVIPYSHRYLLFVRFLTVIRIRIRFLRIRIQLFNAMLIRRGKRIWIRIRYVDMVDKNLRGFKNIIKIHATVKFIFCIM